MLINTMKKPETSKHWLHNRFKSFVFAFRGIFLAFRSGVNIWIQSTIGLIVILAGIAFGITKTEWIFVIIAIGMVLAAEMLNTAIEKLVDFVSPEYNKKAGIVKDIAAGAVLLIAICAAIAGLVIFIPRILNLL